MKTFTVILESYNVERSKKVQIQANSVYEAMAMACTKFPGWMAVEAY